MGRKNAINKRARHTNKQVVWFNQNVIIEFVK